MTCQVIEMWSIDQLKAALERSKAKAIRYKRLGRREKQRRQTRITLLLLDRLEKIYRAAEKELSK